MYQFSSGWVQPKNKKTKLKLKKNKNQNGSTLTNLSLVQAFQITMTGVNEPPLPGKIRMLVKKDLPSYLSLELYSYDKSLTEWQTLFKSYEMIKIFPQREISFDEQYNSFFHCKATGIFLQKEVKNSKTFKK
jgi:hypothetical protein